ncbi:iron-containing alcohol dehydrogenase [Salinadaptatus halalkaliphilus]|uniref:Iron-containing alcohol dehydrogenase n=1 Tax=Salinadaptatus halalkaliphilus TaxID=2419781 RepID=A0A4S3THV4_9EURY|nr:iron-containing alcohol dehydrogenase family protein [Salinadaptatus halalkaliphilus]THE63579.1 iron-containing alcohol dehydrogenase [Salinadaptatus halalkaliphilus]
MTTPFSTSRGPAVRFEYDSPTVLFGPAAVDSLETELEQAGLERALVVCGSTVGSTPAVIDPVEDGLGDRLAGVFAETTPDKRLATAVDGVDRLEDVDADVLVSLGGGSSLDIATACSAVAASDRTRAELAAEFADRGTITVPDSGLYPIVAIPTTLAGAELSSAAGLTADPESGLVDAPVDGGLSHPGLMPTAAVYDPALVATTPEPVLTGSAMNGFDKGIETLYAANATPVTDATATRGLGLFADGLRDYGRGKRDTGTITTILEGLVLVQYGISRPGETMLSIVHAFGHGLTEYGGLQQGVAHAVVVPHVLEYLFDADGVDVRADTLADALEVDDASDPAAAVVDAVIGVRDALDLPTRLRDVDSPDPERFPDVADAILEDRLLQYAPPGLEPTTDDIEAILEQAW